MRASIKSQASHHMRFSANLVGLVEDSVSLQALLPGAWCIMHAGHHSHKASIVMNGHTGVVLRSHVLHRTLSTQAAAALIGNAYVGQSSSPGSFQGSVPVSRRKDPQES